MTAIGKQNPMPILGLSQAQIRLWIERCKAQIRLAASPKLALHGAFLTDFQSPFWAHPYLPWVRGKIGSGLSLPRLQRSPSTSGDLPTPIFNPYPTSTAPFF